MTTVIVGQELRERLCDFSKEVEFRDESGRRVGRFLPEAEYMKMLYDRAQRLFTEEELERASRQEGGKPLAEIWKRLDTR